MSLLIRSKRGCRVLPTTLPYFKVRDYSSSVKVDTSILEIKERNKQIELQCDKYYPSMTLLERRKGKRVTIHDFRLKYQNIDHEKVLLSITTPTVVYGRIQNIRSSGKKIWFIDINDHSHTLNGYPRSSQLQVIINYKNFLKDGDLTLSQFETHMNQLRKNDYIQAVGVPGLSQSRNRNLSLVSQDKLPTLISPIQSPIPSGLTETQKRNNNRVVDYQVNGIQPLIQRSIIINLIRKFYQDLNQFIEVETPLLSSKATGASATPFTIEKDHADGTTPQHLELRISPELWLKRLIIGGMSRIFEIGKMFRNEGIDASHNPEFTMLESYQTYATMEDLIELAEEMVKYVLLNIPWTNDTICELKTILQQNNWHFKRLEFLPTLSQELNVSFQDINLDEPREIMSVLPPTVITNLILHETMSSSQLLDKLSSHFLESKHCQTLHPTIIYHHPLAMSPLAKSVPSSTRTTTSRITQRFEMFIKGKEYINAYEEENCPQIQLHNFLQQRGQASNTKDLNSHHSIDAKYVEAMRSGMPPTGGLGLGIDRLCMLLMEKSRIEQVLPFGSLDDVNRQ